MSSLQIGRLLVAPPLRWDEQIGDPITNLGGAAVPAVRSALRHAADLSTLAADGQTDTLAARLVIRKQLRSMLNNTLLKLQGYLYVQYSDDLEQNGWYVPDQGQLASLDGQSGLATGAWNMQGVVWMLAGHRRTHRDARNIWMKDMRAGLNYRDTLKSIYSTDFGTNGSIVMQALQLSVFPNGAVSAINTVTGAVVVTTALPTGRDGGIALQAAGLVDLACVSYELTDAQFTLSDVICYDRMGQITDPLSGPDLNWLEVYGADWPWNHMALGQSNDIPVLDNGLVRVRYDATNTPGFWVDVWNGSSYVEQGKMCVIRNGDINALCNTWISAGLHTDGGYTPDRAVAKVVLENSGDSNSRETIFITVQRGEFLVEFEVYPAPKAAGTLADAALVWTPALNGGVADLNQSVLKIDSQGTGNWTPGVAAAAQNSGPSPGVFHATAGTGVGPGKSNQFGSSLTTVGAANFTSSENWACILRYPTTYNVIGPYQTTLIVVQAANAYVQRAGTSGNPAISAYGTAADTYVVWSQNSAGYIQCQVAFSPTQAQQVMECESMTPQAGTNSPVADGSASGASTTTSARTSTAPHVTQPNWPNSFLATYRVFVRVRTTAAQMSVQAVTGGGGGTTGAIVTVTGTATPSYTWVDLGEIVGNNSTFTLNAWVSSGSGIVECDRIEAVMVKDQARNGFIYSGARDQAQSALFDSRQQGAVVAR